MDEEVGSIVGNAAGLINVVADDVDVPDFASCLVFLAVEVNLGLWVAFHNFADAVWHRHTGILLRAEDVGHDRNRGQRLSGAERQVQHGPQMLLELGGHAPVLCPVSGVVRAHGQLVDRDVLTDVCPRGTRGRGNNVPRILLSGKGKKLHRQDSGDTEFSGNLNTYLHGMFRQLRREVRGRRESLSTDTVALYRLGHRPCLDLTGRAAGNEHGQFTSQSHLFFRHQCRVSGQKLLYQRF